MNRIQTPNENARETTPRKRSVQRRRFARILQAIIALLCAAAAATGAAQAQTAAGERASVESRFIVDMPTAGILSKGRYAVNVWAFAQSGVAVDFSISPLANFEAGVSYSGAGFLGNGDVVVQRLPGVHLLWRFLDETRSAPAALVGINTQGRGYPNVGRRFETHSPGIFAAASKNFAWLGSLALHGGVGYSLEPDAGDKSPNVWFGAEKTLGGVVSVSLEYNATLDNPYLYVMRRRGMLNAGLRVATGKGFTFELQIRDITQNLDGAQSPYRALRLEYVAAY